MCLEIIARIQPESKGRVGARRLSKLSRFHVSSVKSEVGSAFHFSVTGGCSCEFLSDSADFDAPVWVLNPDHLDSLAEAISLLGSEAKPFSFLTHWLDGKSPKETYEVKLSVLYRKDKE